MKLIASIRRYFDARAEAKTLALLEAEDTIFAERLKQHRLSKRHSNSANDLRDRYGNWGSHPDYPVADWQYEVANDYTRLGYWVWVAIKL